MSTKQKTSLRKHLCVTRGEGDLGRIYERLRKRSYRHKGRFYYGRNEHAFYVAGVRDALNAVATEEG